MVILGLWDGVDAGAALVLNGELVAVEHEDRFVREPRARRLPWQAVDGCLEAAGLRHRDVDVVAVAGRFTPPLFARKHPGLRPLLRPDVFSPAVDVEVFLQATLRHSGFGAADADRAAEWFETVLGARGFSPQRVVMVDMHKALASAAYRCQPDDDVLGLTLHPFGDGLSAAIHRCNAGQIDRAWSQKGFSALHTHLDRCIAAVGMDPLLDPQAFWALAGRGTPDPDLLHVLDRVLRADGPALTPRPYPLPSHRGRPIYKALAAAPREVAAASVYRNLAGVIADLVRWHVREQGVRDVVLGGSVFDNPRLVADLAEVEEIERLWVEPSPGFGALAIGAAVSVAGVAPHRLPPGLGTDWSESQVQRAFASVGVRPVRVADPVAWATERLAAGKGVARFQGRAGFGRHGAGSRSVLVRADDPAAVARVRSALGRSELEEPAVLWLDTPGGGAARHLAKARHAAHGAVAFRVDEDFARRYPAAVTADGRARLQAVEAAHDPELHRWLTAFHQRTGNSALVCFPLASGGGPTVAVPGDAVRTWQRCGLDAIVAGPFVAEA